MIIEKNLLYEDHEDIRDRTICPHCDKQVIADDIYHIECLQNKIIEIDDRINKLAIRKRIIQKTIDSMKKGLITNKYQ